MLKLRFSVCIEATPDQVWKFLADIDKVSLWADPIIESHCEGIDSGVGALRVCRLKGNVEVRERWVEWREGKSFSYVADGVPLVKTAINTWSIKEDNGKTLLSSKSEFVFKGGAFGVLLEAPMGLMMRKMAPLTLAGFKYWVEHGHPYQGPKKLPIAPLTC